MIKWHRDTDKSETLAESDDSTPHAAIVKINPRCWRFEVYGCDGHRTAGFCTSNRLAKAWVNVYRSFESKVKSLGETL